MVLTEQQTRDFKDKGFIVLRQFFDRERIARISALLDELRAAEPSAETGDQNDAKYYEESPTTGERLLVRIENFIGDHNAELTDLLMTPEAQACLTDLFGEPPVLFKDKINYKLPGCRPDKLHQDQAAGWNAYCDFFITMAIAVDENRKDNAAVSIMCSGNYERALMTPEWQPLSENDPPYAPEEEYQLLEADPGDVVLFDSYVPHGSPGNTSDRSRRNIFITFNRQSDGDLRARYYRDKWANYAPNDAENARTDGSFRV